MIFLMCACLGVGVQCDIFNVCVGVTVWALFWL